MNMNRLKFNEGGQPVYLDDLELLQENERTMLRALVGSLTGWTNKVMLLDDPIPLLSDPLFSIGFEPELHEIPSGLAWIQEDFVTFTGLKLSETTTWSKLKDHLYLVVGRRETDSRLCEDGQNRNCRTEITARLALDPEGAVETYKVSDLPTVRDAVKLNIVGAEPKWEEVSVKWANGYSGRVERKKIKDGYRIHIRAQSKQEAWNGDSFSDLYNSWAICDLPFALPRTFLCSYWVFYQEQLISLPSSSPVTEGGVVTGTSSQLRMVKRTTDDNGPAWRIIPDITFDVLTR